MKMTTKTPDEIKDLFELGDITYIRKEVIEYINKAFSLGVEEGKKQVNKTEYDKAVDNMKEINKKLQDIIKKLQEEKQ